MSRVSDATLACMMMGVLSATFIGGADAGGFLKANPASRQERMSEEDVQTSLLAEVEGTFGEGTATSRAKLFETALATIYAALPKNGKGYLGHATVRYALHRFFVQRHGWVIKGLDAAGGHRNSTSEGGLLKEQVPAYLQDLFEKRLGGRGFGLPELAVLAATIEHLIHDEATRRVGSAFKVHDLLPTDLLNVSTADEILDTYMTAYIHGDDLSKMTLQDALTLKADFPEIYVGWNGTKEFMRTVRDNVMKSDASAQQKASGELDFSLVARVAERVSEQFGRFQDRDCKQMKAELIEMGEEKDSGRLRLADFYKPALDGQWQFEESVPYLRQLGALDESDPDRPRVVIANYIYSKANCIASSQFYSICCIDECEGLLSHLEEQIVAPEATPSRIAEIVSKLSSSSVSAPRKLPQVLLKRLGEIAAEHGGTVPLHGRLFAQWMHHAFPRECPYPHISGTTNPQSSDEWLENTGDEAYATKEMMQVHVNKADALKASSTADEEELNDLPWTPEEELLVVRQLQTQVVAGNVAIWRNVVLFLAMVSVAYGLVHNSLDTSKTKGYLGTEKVLV